MDQCLLSLRRLPGMMIDDDTLKQLLRLGEWAEHDQSVDNKRQDFSSSCHS